LSHPAVTLWEQRQALAKLRQQGREQVDESALFRMIGQMREIVTTAQKATRKARRDADRRQHLKAAVPPTNPTPPETDMATRRQTTCHPPNRSTRLRSGSRGRISHHRPVPPAAGGAGLARLPADERIQRLRADRWIGYPRAVEALNRLETLYAWPNKQRMPNLLLVGPTNNGKSMIVEKFRRTHPASSDADQEHIPVLVVQMPSEPSVIRFYVALLAAMGAPCARAHGCRKWSNWRWPAAQGRRAHAGDRRAAQRPGRQQRQPSGIPQPAALPRQRAAHPAGRGRHARRLPGHPLG
jgi:hypothetical protein